MWNYPPARLLVPIDFGDASAHAVRVAGALAARFGAKLTALHAEQLDAPPYFTHDQIGAMERQRIAARSSAERYIRTFVRAHTSIPALARLVEAPPAEAILDATREADLVVMGTHGRRGPRRWWLGSVAERVVRESRVPVLVVRAARHDAPPEDVFKRPLMVTGPQAFQGDARLYATGLADTFNGALADQSVACELDLARQRGASLMVLAREPNARGGFGDAAERLVRSCELPMLFVPSGGAV